MPDLLVTVLFAIGAIGFAVSALEAGNLSRSVVFLWASSVCTGMLFFIFGAYYAAVLQWMVYSGILAVLFLTFIAVAEEDRPGVDEAEGVPLSFDDVTTFGGENL